MSNDDPSEFSELERALRASHPAPLPALLQRQLETAASEAPSVADRFLALWAGTGALAACAAIAMAVWQLSTGPVSRAPSTHETAQQQQMIQQYRQILAMR